jgi:hypothetical protein
MSIHEARHTLEMQAARGRIPEHLVPRLTVDFVLEQVTQAYYGAYFGNEIWSKCIGEAKTARHEGNQALMQSVEGMLTDMNNIRKAHKESHSTSDFPLVLGLARDYVRRQTFDPVESALMPYATKRTAKDFKKLRGINNSGFDRLIRRTELMNIEYATFGESEDGFQIGNYSLALAFSWEMYINDDIGELIAAAAALGLAGRRTRGLVITEAMKALPRNTTLVAGVGGPDVARITELDKLFAAKTVEVGITGGGTKLVPRPRVMTDIIIPARWRQEANLTLTSQDLIVSGGAAQKAIASKNPAYGLATAQLDPMLDEVGTPGDWLAVSTTRPFLEFAALKGYEGGPKAFTKRPDVVETLDEGSFDNQSMAVKVVDNIGVNVHDKDAVILVAGS